MGILFQLKLNNICVLKPAHISKSTFSELLHHHFKIHFFAESGIKLAVSKKWQIVA